jgi:hypothetical protein
MHETLGMCRVGGGQDIGAGDTAGSAAEVNVLGREQSDTGVVMLSVVPGKERPAETASIQNGAEAIGEIRTVRSERGLAEQR